MPMSKQVIWTGTNSIQELGNALKKQHVKKIFLVGGSLAASEGIRQAWDHLEVPYRLFRDFAPNPDYESVVKAVQLFKENDCDAVVGMGGGSAMDVAKCVKLFYGMPAGVNYLEHRPVENDIILAAIPTTAGTGSESTKFAVVYYSGEKQSISHDSILPQYVALDGHFLKGLPDYQKKATFLDALCQAVESKWSVNSTLESQSLADKAISTLLSYREIYLKNTEASFNPILQAANLSGQAINITQTTAAHAMSYKITSIFGIPHGHAVAICLPVVWEYMYLHLDECADSRGKGYLAAVMSELANLFGAESTPEAIGIFRDMLEKMGMDIHREASQEELVLLTSSVNLLRLRNSPIIMSEMDLKKLYQKIFAHC